jgi:hypothetical protein
MPVFPTPACVCCAGKPLKEDMHGLDMRMCMAMNSYISSARRGDVLVLIAGK